MSRHVIWCLWFSTNAKFPNQTHITPELKEKAKATGLEQLDFDGCSELYVKNWDDFEQFYGSPEYANNTLHRKDTANFMAMPLRIVVGVENVIFGQGLNSLGGGDGLHRDDLNPREFS
ncbi:hypothetical protein PV10_05652 [Exophiala mesophila]|uniref:EthD domain-containing protein n=1 Tax=Exophiala mesophila TaxID=212818 RepID=A0A0D1Z8P3_EXOME|nr:uncharacterized protein PV10_05652 [Exophiala mesophila]KIV91067.1 hypothetical protein PV10_05652 [Exophiala mesophila]